MWIRFVTRKENEDTIRDYKLLGYYNSTTCSEDIKLFKYMMDNEIPMQINTKDMVDTEGDEYFIMNIDFVSPTVGGELKPYIEVYVE